MSDPVHNSEVEDVLSSIRRLVSEDKRPLQAPKVDKPAHKPEPANERLVLTPALRVGEDAAPEEAEQEQAAEPQPPRRKETFADLVTDDVLLDVYPHKETVAPEEDAELSEPVAAGNSVDTIAEDYSTDPYNFDGDEPEAGAASPTFIDAKPATVETTDEGASDFDEPEDPAVAGEGINDPEPVSDLTEVADLSDQVDADGEEDDTEQAGTHSLSAKIEALETAISNISDTWEPDDPGDSDYAGTEPEAMEWEDDEPDEDTGRATFVRSSASIAAAKEVSDALSGVDQDREDKASEPKPVFSHKADRSEAEMPGADTIEQKAGPVSIQADVHGAPQPTAASSSSEEDIGLDLDEDAQLIDEDALRDLVSEIVRQELQGALGERITRNVRKLVRREIHRALTAQELE